MSCFYKRCYTQQSGDGWNSREDRCSEINRSGNTTTTDGPQRKHQLPKDNLKNQHCISEPCVKWRSYAVNSFLKFSRLLQRVSQHVIEPPTPHPSLLHTEHLVTFQNLFVFPVNAFTLNHRTFLICYVLLSDFHSP